MDAIQQQIDAGAKAPRVTPADLEAEIVSEHYFTALDGVTEATGRRSVSPDGRVMTAVVLGEGATEKLSLLTFCVLVLRNGFTVTGESACVSAENFDAEIGRKVARKNAVEKLWPLLGFRLADRLAAPPLVQYGGAPLSAEDLAELARDLGGGAASCTITVGAGPEQA